MSNLPPLTDEEVMKMYIRDMTTGKTTRPLTERERAIYGGTVLNATRILPSFADAFAILSPMVDAKANTSYVDEHARVGLSYWFFYVIDSNKRATWLTHEAMHVLNNHFPRGAALGISNEMMNRAGDLEINTTLQQVSFMDLENLLLPELYNLPKRRNLEFYVPLLDEEKNEQISQDSPQSGDSQEEDGTQQGQDSSSDSGSQGDGDSGSRGDGGDSQSSSDSGSSGEGDSQGDGNGSSSMEGTGDGGQGSGTSSSSGSSSSSDQNGDSDSGSQSGQNDDGQGNGDSPQTQADRLQRDLKNKSMTPPPGVRHCDEATEERLQKADDAGIERRSDTAQNVARNNTMARIVDHLNSTGNRGTGVGNDFFNMVVSLMSPPKVDWRDIFRKVVSNNITAVQRGLSFQSYKKVNRRYSQGKIIFPGTVDRVPSLMFGIDTSGSMGKNDYLSLLTEVEGILKHSARTKNGLRVFSVDMSVKDVEPVSSVKQINLNGGGGTDMSVAFSYANSLRRKERPDIFILGTDGYTDWGSVEKELLKATYRSIILITTKGGYEGVTKLVKSLSTVIDVSDDSRRQDSY